LKFASKRATEMIHVTGGTYFERCREPHWDELYGSGLRAAAALSALADEVRLTSYIGSDDRLTLEAYALEYGIKIDPVETETTLRFSYTHGLARPFIDPALHLLKTREPLRVDAPRILRFGMLEGNAAINCDYAVYDPQSAYDPRPFSENGSHADHLAVVTNQHEGAVLTGRRELDDIGRAFLEEHGAEVAVIKSGASGARVYQRDAIEMVPAFRTRRVFPIGSGDVFSAIFAYYWAEARLPPAEAAENASRATAWYCTSRRLPIPSLAEVAATVDTPLRPVISKGDRRRIYLAGPFFTTADRWLVNEARDAFYQQGLAVFSPFHDVGVGPAAEVVPRDIEALDACDAVFAICDRFDAGTAFEVGWARARGIPVVAFVQNEPEEALKMFEGTDCEIVEDFVSAIYRASWAALEK
jgi:nucleoside 2-deoxyribosyltransferase